MIEVPHELSVGEAMLRLKNRIEEAKTDSRIGKVSEVKENWETPERLKFSFKVYGYHVEGFLEMLTSCVRIDFNLPFAAIMMKGMIESQLKAELARVFR